MRRAVLTGVAVLSLAAKLGVEANCLIFTNSFVEIPDDDSLDITDDFTVEAWIKPYSIDDEAVLRLVTAAQGLTPAVYRRVSDAAMIAQAEGANVIIVRRLPWS